MAESSNKIIEIRVENLLKQCKKEGSKNVILALSRSIDNLSDAKPDYNNLDQLSTDKSLDKQVDNNGYSIFHIASVLIIGLFLGFITAKNDKCFSPTKLSFKENVLQKFGPTAAPSILYLHHHLITDIPKNAPTKIFVVAENFEDIIHFNMQISEIFKNLNIIPSIMDVVPKMSSSKLFNDFKDLVFESDKSLIIINNVDNLKGLSPLTIQRIIDSDTAPSKNATIIFTASGMAFPPKMATKKDCEIFVRKHLLNVWSSDGELSEEQIEPIISRCTGIVVCLPSKKSGKTIHVF